VIDYNDGYQVQEWVPGLIGFGDDGGSSFVAMDTRPGLPYPVVSVPFVPMEFTSIELLAKSFVEFIGEIVPEG
jgi:hypothetical protein